MNWRSAKRRELYVVAFEDPGATFKDKVYAIAELERRNRSGKQKYGRMQTREKAYYPK